jgi:hypothetical protein
MALYKSRLNRWARSIGKLAAQPEVSAKHAKTEFELKIRDFRGWNRRVMKKVARQHRASHRALKDFKVGLERASTALSAACQSAVSQFGS